MGAEQGVQARHQADRRVHQPCAASAGHRPGQ